MALPDLSVGTELDADLLNSLPKGIVYQGNRTSNSSNTTTTEIGVLRLDNMNLLAGRDYEVVVGNVRPAQTVAADRIVVRLRYNSGGTATTASAEIGRTEVIGAGVSSNFPQPTGRIIPATDTAVGSVLLCVLRVAGGTGTVQINPDPGGLWLNVIDHGIAVADTGVDI